MMMHRVLVLAVAVMAAASACVPLHDDPPDPAPTGSAAVALRHLTVAGPGDGGREYRRAAFGAAWADVDHNGCDTRNDVLRRDLTGIRLDSDGCTVLSGVLHDRYTGKVIHFRRGRVSSMAVQIDHVVPLHAAWEHGASSWSPARRARLANDRRELLAVDGHANNEKSDGTPSEWKPRRGEWCDYATRYVRVAAKYELSITRADRSALRSMLGTCEVTSP